ncbi:hypothetical protein RFI_27486, partial [Reticulomyxa filosa]
VISFNICLIDYPMNRKKIIVKNTQLIGEFSIKWNEKQLNDASNSLKDTLNEDYCGMYRATLETITVKLSGKQFDNAFNYLICEGKDTYNLPKMIAQRLDEKQMSIAWNYLMDKLNDKNEHPNIRIKSFYSSMGIFTDKNNNTDMCGKCAKLLGIIAVNRNGKHFNDAFKCFTNGLKDSNLMVRALCVQSLVTLSKKWNENHLILFFNV